MTSEVPTLDRNPGEQARESGRSRRDMAESLCGCVHRLAAHDSLTAVLLNPSDLEGVRTVNRLKLLCSLLEIPNHQVVNLCIAPSRTTQGLEKVGASPLPWTRARSEITASLTNGSSILLGYGVTPPRGEAGAHFREQVRWLSGRLGEWDLPTWQVGAAPRHPSRWQRFTSRAHPELKFGEALVRSIHRSGCADGQPSAS